ncbi:MAG TPA: enolase C-terminal domain-like protein [Roseiflexaceae bacterium]|nr:enolase C-terminal domain-like protein [Roseiflexaceae bacterium]
MKVVDYRITPIAFADPPLRAAMGLHAPYALRTIVEIVSDDGITGVSETHGGAAVAEDLEAVRDLVIGRDPLQLAALEADIWPSGARWRSDLGAALWEGKLQSPPRTFGAIEVACLDMAGKALGRPVCDLLGGRVRDWVDFSAYLFHKHAGAGGRFGFGNDPEAAPGWPTELQREALDAETLVEQAQAMVRHFGFKSIKLKAGVLPPEEEVRTIKLLREAFGPDVPLRIDPNAAWSVETSVRWAKELEGLLEYYEDPTGGKEGMAAVAKQTSIPLATNMCTVSFADLPESIRLGSVQIILGDHHFWGGLRASVELARICRTWGIGMSMHSNSHMGISLAAMTHLAAAVPNLTYACDTHYPWQSEEIIVGGKLQFEDGALAVPPGPGLGVELDHAALERMHQQYLDCGLKFRDDEIEMQKVEPGWKYVRPRW